MYLGLRSSGDEVRFGEHVTIVSDEPAAYFFIKEDSRYGQHFSPDS